MADPIKTSPVKGTRDVYPEDMRRRRWLFDHWRAVAEQFGYQEYDACVLEHEALYIRKAGDEITGQLYNFEDKGGRRVTLRPEMTPSLARMVLGKGGSMVLPARWYSIPQCFRYEETQKGRKREHFQWNMDCLGLDTVAAELELMTAQATFLRRVGLAGDDPATNQVVFKVSDRRVLEYALRDLGITGETFAAVCVIIDKRDKIGNDAVSELLAKAGVSSDHAARILALMDVRGVDALAEQVSADNPGLQSLRQLVTLAEAAGIAPLIQIDLSVVRGLSYYTGTVWELFATAGSSIRAIAGGGRYDRLMETFGGKPMPMVGFGFGDVVIMDVLDELGLVPDLPSRLHDVVYPMDQDQFALATRIATALRAAGRHVAVDWSCRRFKHVVRRAEDDQAERLIILGKHEVAQGVAKIRSLVDRDEATVPLEALTG